MKKIIRLTESDLTQIIKRVIKEQQTSSNSPTQGDSAIKITIKGNERKVTLKSGYTTKITDHNYGNIEVTNAVPTSGKYIKFIFNGKNYTCTGTQSCAKG
jgi:hypothetical protein